MYVKIQHMMYFYAVKEVEFMKKIILSAVIIALIFSVILGGFLINNVKSRKLTVLMYHHFDKTENSYLVVSKSRFREQLTALNEAGYNVVTINEVIDFVEGDGKLPAKSLLITMDDGYTSNLEIAAPVLEELSMNATVFVIGVNEGRDTYIHSGETLSPPRFDYSQAEPWVKKGVMNIQSHTYDLHQRAEYGFSGREGVLPKENEGEEEYLRVLTEDCRLFKEGRADHNLPELKALAYPFGFCTPEIDKALGNEFDITFTTAEHLNKITKGNSQSLRMLGRFNVSGELTGEDLVNMLKNAKTKDEKE